MAANIIPVLIVGAGPTGLMMACELARNNIDFRIIDKKKESIQGSNATWIQPSTLEILDHINLADKFIKKGHICNAIHLHSSKKDLVTIPLDYIESIYPYILMLPQTQTEKLLTERLNKSDHKIERSLELIEVKQENNKVYSTIKKTQNKTEIICSNWLIACDGANSTVRNSCGDVFPGEDLSEQFMVADAHMGSFSFNNEVHVFFDKGTVCGVFPMGHNNYRINANLHQNAPRKLFIDKEVKEIIYERTYGDYTIDSVSWISPFWIRSRLVDQMRHGAIFLAGDAAHVHSPAGGQGMNAGLQDAYNLAWKLALVIRGKAKDRLLDSYQAERHPVINKIVSQTNHLTKMALFDKSFLTKLQKFSDKILSDPEKYAKEIMMELTQLSLSYQDSPIIDYHDNINHQSPKQGEHAPNVVMDQTTHLYAYLRNTQHNVLLFCGHEQNDASLQEIKTLQKELNMTLAGLVKTHIISTQKINDGGDVIFDAKSKIHDRYRINTPAVYIIRPDNYIAYYSRSFDSHSLKQFLCQYLKL